LRRARWSRRPFTPIARKARQLDPGELQQVVEAFDDFLAELERTRSMVLGDGRA